MAAPTTIVLSVGAAFAIGVALTASLMQPHRKTEMGTAGSTQVKPIADAAVPGAPIASAQSSERAWSDPTRAVASEPQKSVVSDLKTSRPPALRSAPSLVFNDSDAHEATEQRPTTLAERPKASRSPERPLIEPPLVKGTPPGKTASIPGAKSRSVVANVDRSPVEPQNPIRRQAEPARSRRTLVASRGNETSDQGHIDRRREQPLRDEYAYEEDREQFRRPAMIPLPVRPFERRYEERPSGGYRTTSYLDRGYVYADAGHSDEDVAPYRRQRTLRVEGEPLPTRRASAQTGVMRWLQEPITR